MKPLRWFWCLLERLNLRPVPVSGRWITGVQFLRGEPYQLHRVRIYDKGDRYAWFDGRGRRVSAYYRMVEHALIEFGYFTPAVNSSLSFEDAATDGIRESERR